MRAKEQEIIPENTSQITQPTSMSKACSRSTEEVWMYNLRTCHTSNQERLKYIWIYLILKCITFLMSTYKNIQLIFVFKLPRKLHFSSSKHYLLNTTIIYILSCVSLNMKIFNFNCALKYISVSLLKYLMHNILSLLSTCNAMFSTLPERSVRQGMVSPT